MWPEDLQAIQKRWNNLNTKWFPAGSKPFVFHEVIDMSNEPIRGQHYSHLGRVTDFRYCIKIRETVDNPWNLRYLNIFNVLMKISRGKYSMG